MRRSLQMASGLLAAHEDGPTEKATSFSRASTHVCQHSPTGDTGMLKEAASKGVSQVLAASAFSPSRSRSKAPATAADSHTVDSFFGINA